MILTPLFNLHRDRHSRNFVQSRLQASQFEIAFGRRSLEIRVPDPKKDFHRPPRTALRFVPQRVGGREEQGRATREVKYPASSPSSFSRSLRQAASCPICVCLRSCLAGQFIRSCYLGPSTKHSGFSGNIYKVGVGFVRLYLVSAFLVLL